MPRKAGHNQANFLLGARRAGPDPEGHFNSALVVSNYDINSAGHLKRRKGFSLDKKLPKLGNRKILAIQPFDGTHLYILDDNRLYITEDLLEIRPQPFAISRYSRSTYAKTFNRFMLANTDFSNILSKDTLRVTKLAKSGSFVWIFTSDHFSPFLLEIVEDFLEIYPLYLQNRDTTNIYPFLRSIPFIPKSESLPLLIDSDADYTRYTRLFIDKTSDLTNNKCLAWLGLSLPATARTPESVDAEKVGLAAFYKKPLFFNILPTQAVAIDPASKYDKKEHYIGTVLANLNTKTGLADLATTGNAKANLIRESLFGRKYCIIPYKLVNNSGIASPSKKEKYSAIFKTTPSIAAKTSATFNFKSLASKTAVDVAVPDTAKIKLLAGDISLPDDFSGGFTDLKGPFSLQVDFGAIRGRLSIPIVETNRGSRDVRAVIYRDVEGLTLLDDGNPVDFEVKALKYTEDKPIIGVGVSYETAKGSGTDFPDVSFNSNQLEPEFKNIKLRGERTQYTSNYAALQDAVGLWSIGKSLSQMYTFLNTGLQISGFGTPERFEFSFYYFDLLIQIPMTAFKAVPSRVSGLANFAVRLSSSGETYQTQLHERVPNADPDSIPQDIFDVSFLDSNRDPVLLQDGKPETGKRTFGWSSDASNSKLLLEFTDLQSKMHSELFKRFIKDGDILASLETIAFVRDFDTNKYSFKLAFSKSTDLSSITGVTIDSTTFAPTFGAETIVNSLYEYSAPLANSTLYELAEEQAKGNKLQVDFKLTGIDPEYQTISLEFDPIVGWSRGSYSLISGLDVPFNIEEPLGSTKEALTDSQGLLSLGFHLVVVDSKIKATPYVLIAKNTTGAAAATASLTIAGITYALEKASSQVSEEAVEFQASTLLDGIPSDFENRTVSLILGSVPYDFIASVPAQSDSSIKAECFIFEVGALSVDIRTVMGKRFIGGNDYDGGHATTARFLEGFDLTEGYSHASLVGTEDAWAIKGSHLFRLSKDERLYANNFIELLNKRTSQEFIDTRILSGVQLTSLADNFLTTVGSELQILQLFLNTNMIDMSSNPSYAAIKAYFTGEHLYSTQRIFNAILTDPNGADLEVQDIQTDFYNTSVFLNTSVGIFNLADNALSPSLVSRQIAKTNLIVLNNKLVFLNKESVLINILYSDERKGYVEDKAGKYQAFLYENSTQLVLNPVEDAIYAIASIVTGSVTSFIARALSIQNTIAGFSSYNFQDFEKRFTYLDPLFLFVENNELAMVARLGEETAILKATLDKAYDIEPKTKYTWFSRMVSNPLIYNNLAGFDGATALIGVDKVAIFEEHGTYDVGRGTIRSAGIFLKYPPVDTGGRRLFDDDIPCEDMEMQLDFRQSLCIIQTGIHNIGILQGFQALANLDPRLI